METKQEIKEKLLAVLRKVFYKEGLTNEQLDFRIETILSLDNQTIDGLVVLVEEGVANGFTVNEQMVLIKLLLIKR